MARQIRWSPKAAADLEAICDYIGRDSPHYAALFARQIVSAVRSLATFPEMGRLVPEYGNDAIREVIHRGYRIVYRLGPEAVEIAAICHGAKPLGSLAREQEA